jgi:PPE-repeat protein
MLAAVTAWNGLASELQATAASYQSVLAELANGWAGPSATAMATAAAPYVTWMHETATQAEHTAAQANAAAAAYESAFAMTVPPPVIAANRSQLMLLIATNFLGLNTPAIAATEAHYGEMWAQDATAMYGYAGNSSAASALTPFDQPPQTTNESGPANQAAATGQAAGSAAGTNAQSAASPLSAAPQALQGLTSPATSAQAGSSGVLGSLLSGLPAAGTDPSLAAAYTGLAASLFGSFIIDSAGSFGIDSAGSFGIDLIGVDLAEAFGWGANGLLASGGAAPVTVPAAPLTAGLGQAASVGGLSVPQAWTVAAPAIQQAGTNTALTASAAEAAPAALAAGSRLPLAEMAASGLAGRATAGVGRGNRDRDREKTTTRRQHVKAGVRPPSGPVTKIAPELRELAELRDAGIVTDDEFDEQKRRLLGA